MAREFELEHMKQLYQQILDLKLDYTHMLEAGYDAIFFHFDGKIVGGNQALADLCACSVEETFGLNAFRFFPPETLAVVMEKLKKGSEEPYEIDAHTMYGKPLRVSVWGMNFLLEGQLGRVIGVKKIRDL